MNLTRLPLCEMQMNQVWVQGGPWGSRSGAALKDGEPWFCRELCHLRQTQLSGFLICQLKRMETNLENS